MLYTAKGVASIAPAGIAALIFERFGTWSAVFIGSAILSALAALMAVGLRRAARRRAADGVQ